MARRAAVERQQLVENVVVRNVRRPTVRGSHSGVKGFVCVGEPLRAGVVEVRQRSFLERLRRLLVARNGPLRITGNRLVDPLDPLGRVEPAVAQIRLVASGGVRNGDRTRVGGVLGRGHVRRQAGRERERREGGCRRVAGAVALAETRPKPERPDLVESAVQYAERRVVVAGDDRSADESGQMRASSHDEDADASQRVGVAMKL